MTSSSSELDPHLGQVLEGQFRIVRKLGQGGMGSVYLADQLSMERQVVVKLIHDRFAQDAEAVGRFRQEARLVSKLNHPNVVSVYSFGQQSGGTLYLVMEYVEGRSLQATMAGGRPMAQGRALAIADQVLSALAEAHAKGIVHRDLKPDNIMLTEKSGGLELVKVLDFGIAKLATGNSADTSGLTATGSIIGTPRYMSPEQARNHTLDGRSDLYSLGLVLHELITGAHPLPADTPVDYLIKHVTVPVEPPSVVFPDSGILPTVEQLILRALEKEPDRRFASATEMQQAVRDALAEFSGFRQAAGSQAALQAARPFLSSPSDRVAAPIPPEPQPRPTPTPPPAAGRLTQKNRGCLVSLAALLLVGALLGVLVVAAGALYFVVGVSEPPPSPVVLPQPPVTVQPTVPTFPVPTLPVKPAPPTTVPVPGAPLQVPTLPLPLPAPPVKPTIVASGEQELLAGLPLRQTSEKRYEIKGGYDPASFDLGAFLPRATALAHLVQADAVFYRLDAEAVYPDGRANLTLADSLSVLYRFRSPSRSRPDPSVPEGIPQEMECIVYVYVSPDSIDIYPVKNSDCDDPLIGTPRCSPAQVWKKASPGGVPQKLTVAELGLWADARGKARWLVRIGKGDSSWVADDCGR